MKQAIVTGSTGLVGSAVSRLLCSKGIKVLCLGRKKLTPDEIIDIFGSLVNYIPLPMSQIDSLPKKAKDRGWTFNDSAVFFNFAWSGQKRLTDGNYTIQLANAVCSAKAVKVARRMGCSKFINSGSMEETYLEEFLKKRKNQAYQSAQTYYGLAKLASRNMCKLVSYLEKIDYVHARMSVPLPSDLSGGGYVASSLMKIFRGEKFDPPKSESLFDIILVDEVARAFFLIGFEGQNKADYFIGTGKPQSLSDYFDDFSRLCQDQEITNASRPGNPNAYLFDTSLLEQDVSFTSCSSLVKVLNTLRFA